MLPTIHERTQVHDEFLATALWYQVYFSHKCAIIPSKYRMNDTTALQRPKTRRYRPYQVTIYAERAAAAAVQAPPGCARGGVVHLPP